MTGWRPVRGVITGLVIWLVSVMPTQAQPAQDFLAAHDAAAPRMYWLTAEDRAVATDVLGHAPGYFRLRYWPVADGTAWIMEEIGKERPITLGIVVQNGAITDLQVLVYRESRGGEVRYPFFTRQFAGAVLTESDYRLDRDIDGISGATLSVRAVTNVSRLALYLDRRVQARSDEAAP